MKENLRPFGYLDEYIDMLDVSAETKGEIREKLIDNIQKNISKNKEKGGNIAEV